MCPKSGSVVVGGTAGQVVVFVLVDRDADHLVQAAEVDLFETQTKEQKDKFKWKGHPTLNVKDERHFETAGYQGFYGFEREIFEYFLMKILKKKFFEK